MTLRNPPSWLQNGSHPAENDRLVTQAIFASTGIINTASLLVTANSPAGMSVLVSSGWAAILGTFQSDMGVYTCYNDASITGTITTANPSQGRIDRICLTVSDAYYSGSLNQIALNVVAGTPAASPVAPAIPDNSISLATVVVGAAVTQINSGNITDTRTVVTTNLPVGDLTEVQGGAGISVTSGTGPIPIVAIDSTVTTLTGTQTLTNKTLTTPIIASISNSGTITVPTGTDTLVGKATTDTLTNKTLTDAKINLSINAQTGTTYTFVLTDNGKLVTASNASAITVTIPPISSVAYATGAQLNIVQKGAGQVTFAQGSGVTIRSTGATATAPKLRAQYSSATCIHEGSDVWYVVGDIA